MLLETENRQKGYRDDEQTVEDAGVEIIEVSRLWDGVGEDLEYSTEGFLNISNSIATDGENVKSINNYLSVEEATLQDES